MNDEPLDPIASPKRTRLGLKVGLIGAGVAAGAIAATAVGANAVGADTKSAAATAYSSTGATNAPNAPKGSGAPANAHGSSPVRSDEKSVSDSVAATLKAAALKAVPGGTVYRVETDAGDAAYEAHMTKADGTEVTVKFDENLKVTNVEDGMGAGDPAPSGK